jgi:hypothetical protein
VCWFPHKENLRLGAAKSKPDAHAVEGHRIVWDKTDILQIEPNNNYRKWKEAAYLL